ncbi:MAG: EamA family transporter [Tepidisphaeraceae bacterium]
MQPWLIYALLAAVCASAVAILGKKGMEGVDSNTATAVRSAIMTVFLVGFVSLRFGWTKLDSIKGNAWTLIALSGVMGALSWLFQFKALALADASKVAPIDKLSMPLGILLAVLFLRERPSAINWVGIVLITGGAYLAALKPS